MLVDDAAYDFSAGYSRHRFTFSAPASAQIIALRHARRRAPHYRRAIGRSRHRASRHAAR